MTDSTLDRLASDVRYDAYASMAALARSLLEAGKSQEEVLQACYGVPFPEETFALAELIAEDKEPSGLYTNRPWRLLTPLARGGPPAAAPAPLMDKDERRVFALDSSLVPLMVIPGDYYEYGETMVCYRLEELEA